MRPTAQLLALAEDQHSVLTRQQCLAGGLSRQAIDTLVFNGHWQRLHQGVYVVHSGPIDDMTRIQGALLAAGPTAIVANQTAIWIELRTGPLALPIHLAVPTRSGVRQPSDVRLHHLERLTSIGGDPPRMRPERALLETAHLASGPRAVVDVVCQVMGGRLSLPARVEAELTRRPRQRWRKLLENMLAEVADGAVSPLELRDLRNDRAHSLPVGARQRKLRSGGQGRWLDVIVSVDGRPDLVVVKELDGRLGYEGSGRFRDMNRDNMAAVSLARTLRFGWTDLAAEQCEAAAFQALLWRRLGLPRAGRACQAKGCDLNTRVARLAAAHPLLAEPA